MTDTPILCAWDGEAMRPCGGYWSRAADKQWTVGERYMVEIQHERSAAAHKAYFASIREVWQNLPRELAEQFPDPETLRKAALIATGYRDEKSMVARSNADAHKIAAFVKPADDYAVVSVYGTTVVVLTARSQSYRAMGKATFTASMNRVLDYLASLIGTTPEALSKAEAA